MREDARGASHLFSRRADVPLSEGSPQNHIIAIPLLDYGNRHISFDSTHAILVQPSLPSLNSLSKHRKGKLDFQNMSTETPTGQRNPREGCALHKSCQTFLQISRTER